MKIGHKPNGRLLTSTGLLLAGAVLLFFAGVYLGQRGVGTYLTATWQELTAGGLGLVDASGDDLPMLTIDMPFANYNAILSQREAALAAGVFIAEESDFQPATITWEGQAVPVRLRLRQGTAVHLGDEDKWNFDVRTRDNQLLAGMQRFYLLDPADNNGVYEWAFQESLRREGLLATRYQFVRLMLNGDDRGIYALQEGFGPELVTAQGRPAGPVVEFDATRLWQAVAAVDGDGAAATADPVVNLSAADFRFFEVDTFRDAALADDPALAAQRDLAIGLLRGLQSGQLTAAEVFDVDKYGRFLAQVDLWGATGATHLVNLRYYYHPETGKLEPIGFNAAPLPQDESRRITLTNVYNDPALQVAYIRAVQQFSQPDYLAMLQAEWASEWETRTRQLRGPGQPAAPWEILADRQILLRQSLYPDQPVFAYLESLGQTTDAIIQVDVANVLNLPVEIIGFDIDGATFLEADPAWLQGDWQPWLLTDDAHLILKPVNQETAVLPYIRFHLPLAQIVTQDAELALNQEPTIHVATRLWGLTDTQLTPVRAGYPEPVIRPAVPLEEQTP